MSDFICLHAGNMGQKQGLDNVLRAAEYLGVGNVRLVFAGGGNDRNRLVSKAGDQHLDNVSFVDVQEPGAYESMLRAADVLIVNQRPSVGDMALPSKLTSYFAASRPIVAAVSNNSETAREIYEARGGIVVSADAPKELATAILDLRNDPARARDLAENGRRYSMRYLERDAVLPEYDKFLRMLSRETDEERAVPVALV
jgi:colanic acid biosynthesis glycosyl transferase WcaI